MITLDCPRCHQELHIANRYAGATGHCTYCHGPITVPRTPPAHVPPEPAKTPMPRRAAAVLVLLAAGCAATWLGQNGLPFSQKGGYHLPAALTLAEATTFFAILIGTVGWSLARHLTRK